MLNAPSDFPVYKLDLKDMLPAVRDTIARGGSVRLPVAGSSMQPTMYPHRDWVTLTAAPSVLRRGDLPLYCRANGSAVLHRVVSVQSDGTYTMCGDHQYIREPGIRHDQIVGLVTTLNRKGKEIPVTAMRYRLWIRFWIWMLPLRRHCLRLWSLLLRLFRRK